MKALTLISILTSLLVVTSTSTVYSVLWLVGTFILISLVLGGIDLGFPALLYIIVYVGAIAILFLFVVQLLDLGNEDTREQDSGERGTKLFGPSFNQSIRYKTSFPKFVPSTFVLALIFTAGIIILIVSFISFNENESTIQLIQNSNSLTLADLFLVQDIDFTNLFSQNGGSTQVESLAEWLYGPGLFLLLVVSLILLVAMIAPISLCSTDN